jgi:hypothetical protein
MMIIGSRLLDQILWGVVALIAIGYMTMPIWLPAALVWLVAF